MAKARIPGVKPKHWTLHKWLPALLAAIGGVIVGIIGLVKLSKTENIPTSIFYWGLCALILTGAAAFWGIIIQILEARKKHESDGPNDLKGCAQVLWRILRMLDKKPISNIDCLRITIHRFDGSKKAKNPGQLEQVTDYIGGRGNGRGRKFSPNIGIIGSVIREFEHDSEKSFIVSKRKTDDQGTFVEEMVNEWGYMVDDARQLTHDRCSWMAVVLDDENRNPIGCVYLDSNDLNYFDDKQTQLIVIRGAFGIADYIRERYT